MCLLDSLISLILSSFNKSGLSFCTFFIDWSTSSLMCSMPTTHPVGPTWAMGINWRTDYMHLQYQKNYAMFLFYITTHIVTCTTVHTRAHTHTHTHTHKQQTCVCTHTNIHGYVSIPYKVKRWQEGIVISNNSTNKWILAKIKYDHHWAVSLYCIYN